MAWGSAVQAGVQNFVGGIQQYVNSKAQAKEAKRNEQVALANARAQAATYEAQAKVADIQAAQAQRQGQVEAEKRSRLLAQDIGSVYANAAGNGLIVDGRGKDTVGDVVTSSVNEAQFDISTMNENTAMNVWTHQQAARAYRTSKSAALQAGQLEADAYRDQYKAAKVSAKQGVMQSVSGIPAGIWSAAGVTSYKKFGGLWGGTVGIAWPVTGTAVGYGIYKGSKK